MIEFSDILLELGRLQYCYVLVKRDKAIKTTGDILVKIHFLLKKASLKLITTWLEAGLE